MDELTAKFLPRFVGLAKQRLRNALEVGIDRRRERAGTVVQDLHALAGEAGLLGLEQVTEFARTAEEAARKFGGTGTERDAVALVEALQQLENAVGSAATRSS